MRIGAAEVGRRVVVRHLLGGMGPTGGPALNDVVGHVRAVDVEHVTLERRDGARREILLADIVSWKHVPAQPARRRRARSISVEELTRITSRGWPAVESVDLGDWELRSSGGFSGRSDSVAAVGDPGTDLATAIERTAEFYAARGRPALAQVVVGSAAEEAFLAAGWAPPGGPRDDAIVQVADLELVRPAEAEVADVTLADHAGPDWIARYGRISVADEAARAVLEGPTTVAFAGIGRPATSIGRIVVTGRWAGIAAVETHPDHRRRGQAARIVEACLAWAVSRGAHHAYLQTTSGNAAAIALYARHGFTTHHAYRYLTGSSQREHETFRAGAPTVRT